VEVEYYIKEGFDFAKGILKDFFGKNSLSITSSVDDFENGLRILKRVEGDFSEKGLRAYLLESDLKIRINPKNIEEKGMTLRESFGIWSAYITAFFYPYASFCENTIYGRSLREKILRSYERGGMEEELKREVKSIRRLFSEIGLWAEKKVGEEIFYPSHSFSYFWNEIRTVRDERGILEYLDESKGFNLCNIIERKAKNSFLEEYKKKEAIMEVIKYVDKLEENFLFGFEKVVRELERGEIGIEEIFEPGRIFIPTPQTKEAYKIYFELSRDIITKPWDYVKLRMNDLCEELDLLGEEALKERGKELINFIDEELGRMKGIEKGKFYIFDLSENPASKKVYELLREWLINVDACLKKLTSKVV